MSARSSNLTVDVAGTLPAALSETSDPPLENPWIAVAHDAYSIFAQLEGDDVTCSDSKQFHGPLVAT